MYRQKYEKRYMHKYIENETKEGGGGTASWLTGVPTTTGA